MPGLPGGEEQPEQYETARGQRGQSQATVSGQQPALPIRVRCTRQPGQMIAEGPVANEFAQQAQGHHQCAEQAAEAPAFAPGALEEITALQYDALQGDQPGIDPGMLMPLQRPDLRAEFCATGQRCGKQY